MTDQNADSAAAYHRGRPGYPRGAAAWLVGEQPLSVLELGAGTGKLTRRLVELGHDVHATDPDRAMLDVLERDLPGVRASVAAAEELPLPDRSYDVVVSAQAFDRFELDRALPEIARVLKPRGRLALVWNQHDERIPWVRRLGRLVGTGEETGDPATALTSSGLFGFVEETDFKHWQAVDRSSIQDLVGSWAAVTALEEEHRAAALAEVLALYDDYGRGMDGMQLAYVVRCYRSTVVDDRPPAAVDAPGEQAPGAPADEPGGVSDGTDTDMLLIDFR